MQRARYCTAGVLLCLAGVAWSDEAMLVRRAGQAECRLILPTSEAACSRIAESTFSRFAREFFDLELPVVRNAAEPGHYVVVGTPGNNPVLADLVQKGAKLTTTNLGDEGFQILTFADGQSRYWVLHAASLRAVKHACQELLFFRTKATAEEIAFDWPVDVVMKPAVAYRGVYILPCWSAYDSFESWRRVLRFHSELTLNRNWFWLDGFPVAGHPGEYAGTALASESNVQALIDLCNDEGMKFLIGGGWFNWHHQKAIGKNYAAGRDYYLDYMGTFKRFHGFYTEPTGEGKEIENWRPECEMYREWVAEVLKRCPDFEFAVAIGKFNNSEYLRLMSTLDPKRVYWWWCWGDPFQQKALEIYPTVLRWHTTVPMSSFHGSTAPPGQADKPLAGVVTSYDPGQGFGNPWNGWAKIGTDKVRNFDPYEIPYFGHQYHFRERCWNLDLSEADFIKRLHRRLFDADAPAEAGQLYWDLTRITFAYDASKEQKRVPTPDQLAPIRRFVDQMKTRRCTPRAKDTIARMSLTLDHLGRAK